MREMFHGEICDERKKTNAKQVVSESKNSEKKAVKHKFPLAEGIENMGEAPEWGPRYFSILPRPEGLGLSRYLVKY